MRLVPALLTVILCAEGIGAVQITDAYIKMGSVHLILNANQDNPADETVKITIKANFYEGADVSKVAYVAKNEAGMILKPGSSGEAVVPILYAQGAFTLRDVDIYLDGKLSKTIQDK